MNLLRRALTSQLPPVPETTASLSPDIPLGHAARSPYVTSDDTLFHGNPPPPNPSCTSLNNHDPNLVIYHLPGSASHHDEAPRGAKIYQVSGSIRHWMMTDAEILEDKTQRDHRARMDRLFGARPLEPTDKPVRTNARTKRLTRKTLSLIRPVSKALPSLPLFEDDEEGDFVLIAASPQDPEFAYLSSPSSLSSFAPSSPSSASSDEDEFVLIPPLSYPHISNTAIPPSSPFSYTSRLSRFSSRATLRTSRMTFPLPPPDILELNEEASDEQDDPPMEEELPAELDDSAFLVVPLPPPDINTRMLPRARDRDSVVASYYFGAHMSLDDPATLSLAMQQDRARRPHSHPHLSKIRMRWKGK